MQNPQHSASWKLYSKALQQAGHPKHALAAWKRGIAVANYNGDTQGVKEMTVFQKCLRRTGVAE